MSRFEICQAFQQLEADFNVGGWLRERPSNQRRKESIACQLSRMGYSDPYGWVDIEAERDEAHDDPRDDEVREIYMRHVLLWKLPIDAGLHAAMQRFFARDYLAGFPHFSDGCR